MSDTSAVPETLLRRFRIGGADRVAETAIATIYKVARQTGGEAALKIYKAEGMGNEAPGLAYLQAMDGHSVARILDHYRNAVLMEWLEGPSLGALSREGADLQATHRLADVARSLHAAPGEVAQPLMDLPTWFAALLDLRVDPACPKKLRRDLFRARAIARALLDQQGDQVPLHGDLHHDNVIQSPRGDLAFDAKGLFGARAYELANAFRHPLDRPDLVRDPGRIRCLASIWSSALGASDQRLLEWAVAKCALSITWRNRPAVVTDREADLLHVLLGCLDG